MGALVVALVVGNEANMGYQVNNRDNSCKSHGLAIRYSYVGQGKEGAETPKGGGVAI